MSRWGALVFAGYAICACTRESPYFVQVSETVQPADRAIAVSWTAEAGSPIVGYTATASTTDGTAIGSASCTAGSDAQGCTLSPLTDGATYKVVVTVETTDSTVTTGPTSAMPSPDMLLTSTPGFQAWFDAGNGIKGSGSSVQQWSSRLSRR